MQSRDPASKQDTVLAAGIPWQSGSMFRFPPQLSNARLRAFGLLAGGTPAPDIEQLVAAGERIRDRDLAYRRERLLRFWSTETTSAESSTGAAEPADRRAGDRYEVALESLIENERTIIESALTDTLGETRARQLADRIARLRMLDDVRAGMAAQPAACHGPISACVELIASLPDDAAARHACAVVAQVIDDRFDALHAAYRSFSIEWGRARAAAREWQRATQDAAGASPEARSSLMNLARQARSDYLHAHRSQGLAAETVANMHRQMAEVLESALPTTLAEPLEEECMRRWLGPSARFPWDPLELLQGFAGYKALGNGEQALISVEVDDIRHDYWSQCSRIIGDYFRQVAIGDPAEADRLAPATRNQLLSAVEESERRTMALLLRTRGSMTDQGATGWDDRIQRWRSGAKQASQESARSNGLGQGFPAN